MMGKIDMASFFDPLGARQWKQHIQYDLGGDDYTETLVWESPEGIKVKPFYSPEDLMEQPPLPKYKRTAWKIGQHVKVSDASTANREARHALENGAETLEFGIAAEGLRAEGLLEGINLATTPVHFRFGCIPARFVETLLKTMPDRPAGIFLHLDVIGHLAGTGNWFSSQEKDFETLRQLLKTMSSREVYPLGINGGIYHNSGATVVQQLAYCLSHAHEYLHIMKGDIVQSPVFTMAVGPEYFFEIAKFRAMRLLWASLAPEYGLPEECHMVAVPGIRNKTIYEYNANILRTASECMSAILGNADTVLNLPYDSLFKETNEFSSRLARNQLLILRNESHFSEVSKAADGAYYIETITRQLAESALRLFKQLEAGGGFLKQLREHTIQKKVRESAAFEQQKFDTKEKVLVGVNRLRQAEDKMSGQLGFSPFAKTKPAKTVIEPLSEKRLASEIEKKRLEDE